MSQERSISDLGRPLGFDIVRCFQDGNQTFVQAVQMAHPQDETWISMSLIRQSSKAPAFGMGGRVVRQVTSPVQAPGHPSRAMTTGPREQASSRETEHNRTVATRFFDEVVRERNLDRIGEFIPWGGFHSHNPETGFGRDGLTRFLADRFDRAEPLAVRGAAHVVANGNFVAVFSHNAYAGGFFSVCDLFRFEFGQIVEHWDASQPADRFAVADNDD